MAIFLCIADTHGFLREEQLDLDCRPDALFLLGDLQQSIELLLRCYPGVPAFAVAGNHDCAEPFAGFPVIDLHGRAISWNGISLGGLGGCLRYKLHPRTWLFWEKEYVALLKSMPRVDILLSHCAPFGCWREPLPGGEGTYHHAHEGSRALSEYIVRARPEVVLHGHIHRQGITALEDTEIRSVYGVEMMKFQAGQHCL